MDRVTAHQSATQPGRQDANPERIGVMHEMTYARSGPESADAFLPIAT
jgi:hypothetical protein